VLRSHRQLQVGGDQLLGACCGDESSNIRCRYAPAHLCHRSKAHPPMQPNCDSCIPTATVDQLWMNMNSIAAIRVPTFERIQSTWRLA
jgi:hypothetical protein